MFGMPSCDAVDINNEQVKNLVDKEKYDFYTFKILGGELFAIKDEKVMQKIADSVEYFYDVFDNSGLVDYITTHTVPETLVIASNLLYTDRTALHMCLDRLRSKGNNIKATMMVSYDLYGRFNSPVKLQQYYDNYMHIFNDYSDVVRPVVSFIMSKQNMEALIKQNKSEELEIFNELYRIGAPFDMTLLLNDSHVDQFAYSRELLVEYIQMVKELYPRFVSVYKDSKRYRSYDTIRYTIQGGKVLDEKDLFNVAQKHDCLLCPEYMQCHHSQADVSYNATYCDVREFLRLCAN